MRWSAENPNSDKNKRNFHRDEAHIHVGLRSSSSALYCTQVSTTDRDHALNVRLPGPPLPGSETTANQHLVAKPDQMGLYGNHMSAQPERPEHPREEALAGA